MRDAALRIPLTQGFETVVDWDDLWAVKFKWCVMVNRSTNSQRVYAIRRRPGVGFIYLHREIAGTPEGLDCDHIDGDTLNNRRSNLRNSTRSENNLNRRDVRGVYYHKKHKLWQAYINCHRRRHNLGWFKTEDEARAARARAHAELTKCPA